jgi:glycosyltransferase involved in cell wall biosynthesis
MLAPQAAFTLTLVGRGRAEPEARRFVSEHGLQSRVRFAGWLQGADLEAQLAGHDVLVLPSWEEGLPNAMIEAMAAGLAVVASAVGNIPDVVADEREALLVPARDPQALSAALLRVLTDAPLRDRLQRAGHVLAAAQFAVEPAMRRLAAIILANAPLRDREAA